MPHTLHQVVASLFRDDPGLGFDLLRSVFGLDVPALQQASDRSAELDRFVPCFGDTEELRVDVALSARFVGEPASEGAALVVEVQRQVSRTKRFRMWVYWALLAERLELPTALLVVPLSDEVARWASRLGQHELPPRDCLLVLDRQKMPRITSVAQAEARPALAMLSAAVHSAGRDLECMQVAMSAALKLSDSRRWRYASAIFSALTPAEFDRIKEQLEMDQQTELTQMELNSVAYYNGLRKGEIKGELEGLRRLVVTILELRGLKLDPARESMIHECLDLEQLEQWADRAKRVDSAAQLFTT